MSILMIKKFLMVLIWMSIKVKFMPLWDLNGSGKSTLANVLLGHPRYSVISGDILVNNESIINLKTDERAKKGLFLGFQYPTEVSGVGYSHFLRNAYNLLSKILDSRTKGTEKFS